MLLRYLHHSGENEFVLLAKLNLNVELVCNKLTINFLITFNVKKHLEDDYVFCKEGKENDKKEFVTLQMLKIFYGKEQKPKQLGHGDLSVEHRVYRESGQHYHSL